MIKLLNNNTYWNKEINITLSLKELQSIYDSFAVTTYADCEEQWLNHSKDEMPCNSTEYYNIYKDLENVLRASGGEINE